MNRKMYQMCKKYPKIFVRCWPEVGNGWCQLLDNLCEHIQSYIDNNKHLNIEQLEATQVKEKFGTLRFYSSGGNEYIRGFISHAEWLSSSTCELCGDTKTAKLRGNAWLTTQCDVCWTKTIVQSDEYNWEVKLKYHYIRIKQWIRRKLRL